MIFEKYPNRALALAIAMLLFGCIMPFLMTIKVVESTFFMNFLSFGVSTLGLFLGIAAIAMLQARKRKGQDEEDRYR